MSATGEKFERAVSIMARLRAPGGCPWDREQTFASIKPYTVEETYEVLEAIDAGDYKALAGELGDLLLQVLFYSELAREAGHFTIDDVLERLAEKLIRRHPHVFGDVKAETSREVVRNWEALKAGERAQNGETESVLRGASPAHPALVEAYKLSSLAANVGFDWPNIAGVFEKLAEETKELRRILARFPAPGPRPQGRDLAGAGAARAPEPLRSELEEEAGDLLFAAVNLARYLQLDPESALKRTNRKFRRRFEYMEARLREQERRPQECSLQQLEALWQEAKKQEPAPAASPRASGKPRR